MIFQNTVVFTVMALELSMQNSTQMLVLLTVELLVRLHQYVKEQKLP